eukprot:scaffold1341_cov295-Chaetoceros_neogracile.AAC.3
MKLSIAITAIILATAEARRLKKSKSSKSSKSMNTKCSKTYSQTHTGPFPLDNSERMLLREGIIDEIPASLCSNSANGKNVMLVVGDGMGWEMVRAGAVAKAIIDELESMGCDT